MASRQQQTGMRGVFIVAAELSSQGYVVSITSRNAMGADILATDEHCEKAYSIQVKTNGKKSGFWLVGEKAKQMASDSHYYVLVNLCEKGPSEFFIVPSKVVANKTRVEGRKTSTWYSLHKSDISTYQDAWQLK